MFLVAARAPRMTVPSITVGIVIGLNPSPGTQRHERLIKATAPSSIGRSPFNQRLHAAAQCFCCNHKVKATAGTLGLEVAPLEIRHTGDVAPTFETLQSQIDALYVVTDALISANRSRIITFALSRRLPTTFNTRDYVRAGGLMSYGPNFPALFRHAAD